MAVAISGISTPEPAATSLTLSMSYGWQPGPGPAAGDLIVIQAEDPPADLCGPPGWTQLAPDVFYRILMPKDADPTFTSPSGGEIALRAQAFAAGSFSATPSAEGSAVP